MMRVRGSALSRLARNELVTIPLGALAFALVFSWPLLGHLATPGASGDWDMLLGLKWVSYETIVKFHQFPLWDPYRCGGLPQLGNPQSQIISPFFPLTLLYGPFLGTHLQIIMSLAVAWSGCYLLARVIGIRPLGALAAATVFPASSWFYLKLGVGHVYGLEATYAPWGYAAAWVASERRAFRYAALAGAVFALMFLGSGPDAAIYSGVGLGVLLLALAIVRKSWWPLWILVVLGIFAVGFAAIKLAPTYVLLLAHPRHVSGELEVNDVRLLLIMLFSQDQSLFRGLSNGWGFWECGAYIGIFAIPAMLGLLEARRAAPWIIAGAILLLLARGDAHPLALWPIVAKLPMLDSVRLPSRFLMPFTLVVGMLAGYGIDWLAERWTNWGALAGLAVTIVATVNCLLVGPPDLVGALQEPAPPAAPATVFHQISHGPRNNSMLIPAMENTGVVDCYDYTQWNTNVKASDRAGYRGEAYLLGPGSVGLERWTPNALTYSVSVPADSEIVVNQNYDRWWHVVAGRGAVVNEDGLIGVRMPPGTQTVTIAYRDYGALVGAIVTLATIAAAIVLWRRESSTDR
jgi:hypothetical protein